MSKVLVADPIAEQGIARLRSAATVDVHLKQSPADLKERIPDYDALIVRSETRVDAGVIEAGSKLKVVGRAGAGIDNIDIQAATRRGVLVVNAPSGNTVAAAEHTMAMMMALARHVPQADHAVKAGRWERSKFVGSELKNKVLAVIGLGNIGSEVARRAQAFGMRVLGVDPVVSTERAAQLQVVMGTLDQVLPEADFVTVHVPLIAETRHVLNHRTLALCRKGVRIINVARGGVVDEAALYEGIKSGHVGGAALDVFEKEPPGESPLLELPQVICTPHLGASTEEAQIGVAIEIADQVLSVLSGELPRFALNAPVVLPQEMAFLRPYLKVAQGLGRFFAQVARHPVTRLQLEYLGEIAAYDCSVLTATALTAYLQHFSSERVNHVNAATIAAARGITVTEQRSTRAGEFSNLISLTAEGDGKTTRLAATLLLNEPRIVALNDFRLDLVPQGSFVMSWHADRPGIIGAIGTLLGRNNINIASMQVGRNHPRGDAVMILSVDEPVPDAILQQLRAVPGMADVQSVTL